MGIKNLNRFLKEMAPRALQTVSDLERFRGQRFAIDVAILMYKYVYLKEDHMPSILRQFKDHRDSLAQYGIKSIYVFDGAPHKSKDREKEKRLISREENENRVKRKIQKLDEEIQETASRVRHLSGSSTPLTYDASQSAEPIDPIEGWMIITEKKEQQRQAQRTVFSVTPQHYADLKVYMNKEKIEFVTAVGEAEKACAWMVQQGIADIAVTEDTDVLVCGSPWTLQNLFSTKQPQTLVSLADVLKYLKLTLPEFVDFGILCGCDFSGTLPGIGPKKAYEIILAYRKIENYLSSTKGSHFKDHPRIKEFHFEEARKMFLDPGPQVLLPSTEKPENKITKATKSTLPE